MPPHGPDEKFSRRGFAGSVREHGNKIALVGFALVLVSTRVLGQDGHTSLSLVVIAVGFTALIVPFVVPRVWGYHDEIHTDETEQRRN